ncbi:MAG: hypothetical protein COU69_01400 [Candidatus Pacebacteria bacterium CG10_big_fil_rev_8_21_14_0_10_56_10]|nr:MAG: hypothetical protein COU69_01400 [Candidatus Pacebacteria bacterium CG10_big_fil_rev_8_21_14_0_10_56_10]
MSKKNAGHSTDHQTTDNQTKVQVSDPVRRFVDISNARHDDQRDVMRRIIAAGHCPFCRQNLERYHTPPIIKEGKYWLITTNKWPYRHTRHHWLLIGLEHWESFAEAPAAAGAELFELVAWLERQHNLPGGGVAIRFGDTDYSAGTVKHLHAQVIIPDIEADDFQPTRFKIGKG